MNAAKADHSPHIYAIADQAYQMMMHQKKNQVLLAPLLLTGPIVQLLASPIIDPGIVSSIQARYFCGD